MGTAQASKDQRQVPVPPAAGDILHSYPLARLTQRWAFSFFKEVTMLWILLGYALCAIANAIGWWKLYFAARHSFRSGRPDLFLQYWQA